MVNVNELMAKASPAQVQQLIGRQDRAESGTN
jgi:hypothetical protein